ncbi:Uncharacterised protein [Mycobacteroides abscessus]|nr:Uncharacterised protein [Mycobacteroides abscessus]
MTSSLPEAPVTTRSPVSGDPDAVSVQSAGAAVPPSSLTTSLTSVSIGGHTTSFVTSTSRVGDPAVVVKGSASSTASPSTDVTRAPVRTQPAGRVVVSSTTTSCAPPYPPRSAPHGWALGPAPSGPVSVSAASRPSGCSPSAKVSPRTTHVLSTTTADCGRLRIVQLTNPDGGRSTVKPVAPELSTATGASCASLSTHTAFAPAAVTRS